MKKVGIIGSGISSLSAAYYLKKQGFHITVFEANDYFGGHTNTIDIEVEGKAIAVDTGFLVHNDRTYPNLIKLFDELQIPISHSVMSLSVQILKENIEWCGDNFATLFAQKKNIISPKFWSMLLEVVRFNKSAVSYLSKDWMTDNTSLGELLSREKYSKIFNDWYLIPMGAAIWSTPANKMLDYPARTFIQFCNNHGLLNIIDRPQWRTVTGGTRLYVDKILKDLDEKHLNEKVQKLTRAKDGVRVVTSGCDETFDYVISGVHAPANFSFVKDMSDNERKILKNFVYQPNRAVVHSDLSLLPKRKHAWAAWNYATNCSAMNTDENPVGVSYLINKLQPLGTEVPIIVTLNPHKEIDPALTYQTIDYEHPLFDAKAVEAQQVMDSIQGIGGLYYAGAWQGYGFHEDGIKSGINVSNMIASKG